MNEIERKTQSLLEQKDYAQSGDAPYAEDLLLNLLSSAEWFEFEGAMISPVATGVYHTEEIHCFIDRQEGDTFEISYDAFLNAAKPVPDYLPRFSETF